MQDKGVIAQNYQGAGGLCENYLNPKNGVLEDDNQVIQQIYNPFT